MSSRKSFLFDYDDLVAGPEHLNGIGGKATNLFYLTQSRIPVPRWCVIDHETVDSIKGDGLTVPAHEMSRIFGSNFDQKFYAVRSSASCEDGKSASFSGQFSSFLFVPVSEVDAAIRACIESLDKDNVIEYLAQNNLDRRLVRMAVLIQEMVESEKSGVLFTSNPTGRLRDQEQVVVAAGYGLGEGIVASKVPADTFYLKRSTGELVSARIEEKDRSVVLDVQRRSGLVEKDVPVILRKKAALGGEELKKLYGVAMEIERFYNHPQDIEWALDGHGKLFILQSRPITTLREGVEELLDNANISESFPGIVLPMSQDFILPVYEKTFKTTLELIGFTKKEVADADAVLSNLVTFVRGRAYYNLSNWFAMMRLAPFTESYIRTWKEMLGVDLSVDKTKTGLISQLWAVLRFVRVAGVLAYQFFVHQGRLHRLRMYEEQFSRKFYSKEKWELQEFKEVSESFESDYRAWGITLVNDLYAFVMVGLAQTLWVRVFRKPKEKFLDVLLVEQSIDSMGPVLALDGISAHLRQHPQLLKELAHKVQDGDNSIRFSDSQFQRRMHDFIDSFGDRCIGELKLETVTYREHPILFYQFLLLLLEKPDSTAEGHRDHSGQHVSFPWGLGWILVRARAAIVERENFRLLRSKRYGMVRRLLNSLGDRLVEKGALTQKADIFYLRRVELIGHIDGHLSVDHLKWILASRKKEYAAYDKEKGASTLLRTTLADGTQSIDSFEVETDASSGANGLTGIPCSGGRALGRALVLNDPTGAQLTAQELGESILVTQSTDPGWVFLMQSVRGLIVERGSVLSHSAIIGRELGLPTITGVKNATSLIRNGDQVEMDGSLGTIEIHRKE